jgi:hypothetical protein
VAADVVSSPTLRGARLGAASAKLFARHTTSKGRDSSRTPSLRMD